MSVWVDISHAPKDGTLVDLWGYDRDPAPGVPVILLPIELSLKRWTDCAWTSFMEPVEGVVSPGGVMFLKPTSMAWFTTGRRRFRIWPTHYMEIPKGPNV